MEQIFSEKVITYYYLNYFDTSSSIIRDYISDSGGCSGGADSSGGSGRLINHNSPQPPTKLLNVYHRDHHRQPTPTEESKMEKQKTKLGAGAIHSGGGGKGANAADRRHGAESNTGHVHRCAIYEHGRCSRIASAASLPSLISSTATQTVQQQPQPQSQQQRLRPQQQHCRSYKTIELLIIIHSSSDDHHNDPIIDDHDQIHHELFKSFPIYHHYDDDHDQCNISLAIVIYCDYRPLRLQLLWLKHEFYLKIYSNNFNQHLFNDFDHNDLCVYNAPLLNDYLNFKLFKCGQYFIIDFIDHQRLRLQPLNITNDCQIIIDHYRHNQLKGLINPDDNYHQQINQINQINDGQIQLSLSLMIIIIIYMIMIINFIHRKCKNFQLILINFKLINSTNSIEFFKFKRNSTIQSPKIAKDHGQILFNGQTPLNDHRLQTLSSPLLSSSLILISDSINCDYSFNDNYQCLFILFVIDHHHHQQQQQSVDYHQPSANNQQQHQLSHNKLQQRQTHQRTHQRLSLLTFTSIDNNSNEINRLRFDRLRLIEKCRQNSNQQTLIIAIEIAVNQQRIRPSLSSSLNSLSSFTLSLPIPPSATTSLSSKANGIELQRQTPSPPISPFALSYLAQRRLHTNHRLIDWTTNQVTTSSIESLNVINLNYLKHSNQPYLPLLRRGYNHYLLLIIISLIITYSLIINSYIQCYYCHHQCFCCCCFDCLLASLISIILILILFTTLIKRQVLLLLLLLFIFNVFKSLFESSFNSSCKSLLKALKFTFKSPFKTVKSTFKAFKSSLKAFKCSFKAFKSSYKAFKFTFKAVKSTFKTVKCSFKALKFALKAFKSTFKPIEFTLKIFKVFKSLLKFIELHRKSSIININTLTINNNNNRSNVSINCIYIIYIIYTYFILMTNNSIIMMIEASNTTSSLLPSTSSSSVNTTSQLSPPPVPPLPSALQWSSHEHQILDGLANVELAIKRTASATASAAAVTSAAVSASKASTATTTTTNSMTTTNHQPQHQRQINNSMNVNTTMIALNSLNIFNDRRQHHQHQQPQYPQPLHYNNHRRHHHQPSIQLNHKRRRKRNMNLMNLINSNMNNLIKTNTFNDNEFITIIDNDNDDDNHHHIHKSIKHRRQPPQLRQKPLSKHRSKPPRQKSQLLRPPRLPPMLPPPPPSPPPSAIDNVDDNEDGEIFDDNDRQLYRKQQPEQLKNKHDQQALCCINHRHSHSHSHSRNHHRSHYHRSHHLSHHLNHLSHSRQQQQPKRQQKLISQLINHNQLNDSFNDNNDNVNVNDDYFDSNFENSSIMTMTTSMNDPVHQNNNQNLNYFNYELNNQNHKSQTIIRLMPKFDTTMTTMTEIASSAEASAAEYSDSDDSVEADAAHAFDSDEAGGAEAADGGNVSVVGGGGGGDISKVNGKQQQQQRLRNKLTIFNPNSFNTNITHKHVMNSDYIDDTVDDNINDGDKDLFLTFEHQQQPIKATATLPQLSLTSTLLPSITTTTEASAASTAAIMHHISPSPSRSRPFTTILPYSSSPASSKSTKLSFIDLLLSLHYHNYHNDHQLHRNDDDHHTSLSIASTTSPSIASISSTMNVRKHRDHHHHQQHLHRHFSLNFVNTSTASTAELPAATTSCDFFTAANISPSSLSSLESVTSNSSSIAALPPLIRSSSSSSLYSLFINDLSLFNDYFNSNNKSMIMKRFKFNNVDSEVVDDPGDRGHHQQQSIDGHHQQLHRQQRHLRHDDHQFTDDGNPFADSHVDDSNDGDSNDSTEIQDEGIVIDLNSDDYKWPSINNDTIDTNNDNDNNHKNTTNEHYLIRLMRTIMLPLSKFNNNHHHRNKFDPNDKTNEDNNSDDSIDISDNYIDDTIDTIENDDQLTINDQISLQRSHRIKANYDHQRSPVPPSTSTSPLPLSSITDDDYDDGRNQFNDVDDYEGDYDGDYLDTDDDYRSIDLDYNSNHIMLNDNDNDHGHYLDDHQLPSSSPLSSTVINTSSRTSSIINHLFRTAINASIISTAFSLNPLLNHQISSTVAPPMVPPSIVPSPSNIDHSSSIISDNYFQFNTNQTYYNQLIQSNADSVNSIHMINDADHNSPTIIDQSQSFITTTIDTLMRNLSSSPLASVASPLSSPLSPTTLSVYSPSSMTTTTSASSLLISDNYLDSNQNQNDLLINDTLINDWFDILIIILKVLTLGTIIFSAIFGNLLVIIAVFRHHRLRITTNYFIVSLAFADILVALFAMTFNASVVISNRWIFNQLICDFWNSCDVLFSTASIMHLSCISYDRYYAIIKPLDYPMKVTGKRVAIMLTCVWILSALISYIPIFTGIYTTAEAMEQKRLNSDQCEWIVNIPYALISSTISFWLPCSIMLSAYYKIYKEAIKQEKFIYRTQQMANQTNHHHHHYQKNRQVNTLNSTNNNNNNNNNNNPLKSNDPNDDTNANNDDVTSRLTAPPPSSANSKQRNSNDNNNVIQIQSSTSTLQQQQQQQHRNSHCDHDPESGSSTPTKRTISKMKREHKAAKTLGIIMGAFILCWLPFFIWYVVSTIMAADTPKVIVHILFWVGYLNSAMNPIIYAYFNREFREAFKETLRNIFCKCFHLKCLETQRQDAISFSCTYRSTMDVGLVENKYSKD